MEIKINNHKFNVNPSNQKSAYDYINSGLWEPESFEIFDFFTNENDCVIDLGCWNGITALYLANKVKTVYAIDADPVCFFELEKNIQLNPSLKDKVKPLQLAISNKKEKLNLFAREAYGESSTSILPRKRDKISSFKINTISMLDFIKQEQIDKVDFIKMDIEGAEFLILPQIKSSLIKIKYPTLFISFHYNHLNEYEYSKIIGLRFFTKLILKVEKLFSVSFLKKKIEKSLENVFNELDDYKYIYTHKGELILYSELIKRPSIIKENELIFTNKKWK